MALKHAELTHEIIGAYYAVYNELGYGFLEKVYENAMAHELRKRGLNVVEQQHIQVEYDGVPLGDYIADMIVDNKIILELKAADAISPAHVAQLTNYLRATYCEVGFVFNFGPKVEYERRYFSNDQSKGAATNPK